MFTKVMIPCIFLRQEKGAAAAVVAVVVAAVVAVAVVVVAYWQEVILYETICQQTCGLKFHGEQAVLILLLGHRL